MKQLQHVDVAVVGTGNMGSNHVRVLSELPGVRLIGVLDTDIERAETSAASAGTYAFSSLDDLLAAFEATDAPRAAVVTTPTPFHVPVATALAEQGVHILVEKPVATTVEEAEVLCSVVKEHGVVSMVGHIERFNPVIREMCRPGYKGLLHIDMRRIGPFTPRILDNVIDDLMIHDLDIARVLAGSPLVDTSSVARIHRSSSYDMASALLTFESGVTASLTASRLGQKKVRTVELTLDDAVVSGDLLHQTLTIHRSQTPGSALGGHGHAQTSAEEVPFLTSRVEPLAAELNGFLGAVRSETESPIPLTEGVEAMRMAATVRSALRA